MKKSPLLNGPMSSVIASMGHTDGLCIGDAGLPIPEGPERIDLAVTEGLPAMLDVLRAAVAELQVERVVVASELVDLRPNYADEIRAILHDVEAAQGNKIEVRQLPHEALKTATKACKAVVRSGECSPYANIILYAGVTF